MSPELEQLVAMRDFLIIELEEGNFMSEEDLLNHQRLLECWNFAISLSGVFQLTL